ncbi:MAG TPA: ROK family protein [Acidimicrobiia bacterium]|nr:ROK family protein [Acidimicrobiia bacterium]
MTGKRPRADLGSVEAGGTNIVCAVGSANGELAERVEFPTTGPGETLLGVVEFFESKEIVALGLGWFGPIEVRPSHPRHGVVGPTPKRGWEGVDVLGPMARLGVPMALATDVGAAALGEGEWGAAVGLASHVYVTVGTGIGGATVVDGSVLVGLGHSEMGHVPVARAAGDDFPGVCPFHGDCLEGLASGPAVAARWGSSAEDLEGDLAVAATELVAEYVAQGLRTVVYTIAPERVVVGGGVSRLPGFHAALREALVSSLAGYPGLAEHHSERFVVPPGLGDLAGVKGGLVLARGLSLR